MASGNLNAEAPTQRALLLQAGRRLQQAGCDTPRLDAEVLWMHASGQSRVDLIIHAHDAVRKTVEQAYLAMVARRQAREPVAYITGEKEFWSRMFYVTPETLIPRPETEHIIEWALASFPDREQPWVFADVGTGSGCIAVTLACEFPQSIVLASDISQGALRIAQRNARRHGVAERVFCVAADLLCAAGHACFDAVLSNPPYVSAEEMNTLKEELAYEPASALTDSGDGLHCMRTLLQQSGHCLKPGASLIVETGLCGYITPAPEPMSFERVYHDLAGHVRGAIYIRNL